MDHAIAILRGEIHRNMAPLGINRLGKLGDTLVRRVFAPHPSPGL